MADGNSKTEGFQSIGDILGDNKDSAALTALFGKSGRDTRDIPSTPGTIRWLDYEAGKARVLREAREQGTGLSSSQYEQEIYALTERQDI